MFLQGLKFEEDPYSMSGSLNPHSAWFEGAYASDIEITMSGDVRDVVEIMMVHHYCDWSYDETTLLDIKECYEGEPFSVMNDWGVVATRESDLACSEDPMNMNNWDNMVIMEIPEYSLLPEFDMEGDYFLFTHDAVFDWWSAHDLCEVHGGRLGVVFDEDD